MRWNWLATTGAGLAAVAAGGAALVAGGVYDVAATQGHTAAVHRLLEVGLERSVRVRARRLVPPDLDAGQRLRGAACFREWCVQCHGAPGRAPSGFAQSMQPVPGPLVDAGQRWTVQELYWITRHGIKMTGMPAWRHRLDEADLWAVAAFVGELDRWSPEAFERHMAATGALTCRRQEPVLRAHGDVGRGRELVQQFGCRSCHRIPGMVGPDVHVGPPLEGMARRALIAGRLPNTEDQLVRWLRQPRHVDPRTAMPDLGLGEQDARDMAAYLRRLP